MSRLYDNKDRIRNGSNDHKKKITSGYFRKNAELGAVFVFVDGVEYQVNTSELDLNAIIDDISMAGDDNDLSEYLYKTNLLGNNPKEK